jgi:GT2 family glycosyltransferase
MNPKVGIVILNWNGRDDTIECLDSVYRMEYDNYEVIVVDNGSTDGSAETARSRFPKTLVMGNKMNRGFSGGNNDGIRRALEGGAEYVLILNNDTVVEPALAGELVGAHKKYAGAGAITPFIADYDDRKKLQFFGSSIDWANGDVCRQCEPADAAGMKDAAEIDFASGCATLFTKAALGKVGLFDENFFAYYEDTDWSMRSRKAGLKTLLYPKVLVYHKASRATGGRYSPAVYFYLFRNRLLFMKKHAPLARKIQFTFCYVSDILKKRAELLSSGEESSAKAVMDGFWSAVHGYFGDKRLDVPGWTKECRCPWTVAHLWLLAARAMFIMRVAPCE